MIVFFNPNRKFDLFHSIKKEGLFTLQFII